MVDFVSAPVIMLLALGATAIAAALYVLIKDTQKVTTPYQTKAFLDYIANA